ncbi:MAG: efflux RND transporter periplasmic adaptor subunit [Lewinella sp.]|uniref:efflux RND transporter periplasmic adaptor subunit n=1 Tax=Lewinella sp. TaxID=2004506 RepID=UPI003D6C52F5
MTNRRIKSIGLILLIGLAAGGYLFFNQQETAATITTETVLVGKGDIAETITATGTVEPITQIEVGTQVSGVVEKVYVDYNSTVKKGQLIAELDKTNLSAAVAEAKTNLAIAQNELDYLQTLADRKEALFSNNNGSKADYEEAMYKLEAAQGNLSQRKIELSRAQTNLGYANIYSPIAGVVLSKGVNVGQTVAASFSTPTLFTIAQDLSKMQVEADVDEADVGNVQPGQRVAFTVDAFTDEVFNGIVTQLRLNPTVTSNVVTYTVVIKADNPDLKLLPGLTATVTIYTYENNDVLTLSARAINFEPDKELLKQYHAQFLPSTPDEGRPNPMPVNSPQQQAGNEKTVWVKKGNQLVPITITVGQSDGIKVEVLSGLEAGDEVVANLKVSEVPVVVSKDGSPSSPFMPTPPGGKRR